MELRARTVFLGKVMPATCAPSPKRRETTRYLARFVTQYLGRAAKLESLKPSTNVNGNFWTYPQFSNAQPESSTIGFLSILGFNECELQSVHSQSLRLVAAACCTARLLDLWWESSPESIATAVQKSWLPIGISVGGRWINQSASWLPRNRLPLTTVYRHIAASMGCDSLI